MLKIIKQIITKYIKRLYNDPVYIGETDSSDEVNVFSLKDVDLITVKGTEMIFHIKNQSAYFRVSHGTPEETQKAYEKVLKVYQLYA